MKALNCTNCKHCIKLDAEVKPSMQYRCDRHEIGGQWVVGDAAAVEINSKIAWKGSIYRVTGFMKKIEGSIWKWQFVSWDEATHVSGVGIAGCIVPFEEVKIVGHMRDVWNENSCRQQVEQAERLIGHKI